MLQWKGLVVYCPLCQNLQLSKSIDAGDGRLMDLVDSSSTTRESMESKDVLRNDDCTNSGVLLSNGDRSSELAKLSHLVASDALQLGVAFADRDSHSGLGKSMGEVRKPCFCFLCQFFAIF